MAADEVRFPSPDDLHDPHAREIGERLRASYATLPAADDTQVERVTRAVLAQAMHASAPSRGGARPRWWWGAAAAALFMVVLTRPWRPEENQRHADSAIGRPAVDVPRGSTREERGGTVRFEFTMPSQVREVALVGDFNGWDTEATPMARDRSGTWSARIPLEPGRHEYAFVVDGQRWVVDPLALQVPDAGYGPTNAVVVDGGAQP